MSFPRILIAGVQSGVGKTTLTLGLLAALKRRGIKVQPFKVGPDYIDPGLHYHAAGVKSHNLDSWMGSEEVVKTVFARNAQNADISIIEGVMGLFDGARGERLKGSSAHIAMILKAPVILVVNVKGMARSCAALVKGYKEYVSGLDLKGVILNNAGSDYYKTILAGALEDELGVKVLGCLAKNKHITMPERHLGLLPAEENNELSSAISLMADLAEAEVDVDALLAAARASEPVEFKEYNSSSTPRNQYKNTFIGVARDQAFTFYYQDSLDYLQELGARLVYFSPLKDSSVPDVDGLYIGGGFPEMFIKELSENQSMITSLHNAHDKGLPIFAECGGFMYLTEKVVDFQGNSWPGVGLVPVEVKMTNKLAALGYVKASALKKSIIGDLGDEVKGHEFHYSVMSGIPEEDSAFSLVGGKGADYRRDGYARRNLFASYVHIHLRSNPKAALNFLDACRELKQRR
ncbi:cobyrinate a,c-diamide synthase [Desulfitibacter alkalitolerans]|uniref:cobyrinate a,c-diamide synthase n=1 Tax=Desulfitibacter alkalitolerans TaxID=264641 RepID=UPI000486E75F|nr:cobyrinate a,c-diamide synthase [Desulfitibacter alkalitolerans]